VRDGLGQLALGELEVAVDGGLGGGRSGPLERKRGARRRSCGSAAQDERSAQERECQDRADPEGDADRGTHRASPVADERAAPRGQRALRRRPGPGLLELVAIRIHTWRGFLPAAARGPARSIETIAVGLLAALSMALGADAATDTGPRHEVGRLPAAPTLDGRLAPGEGWADAVSLPLERDAGRARGRAGWHGDALYLAFEVAVPPQGLLRRAVAREGGDALSRLELEGTIFRKQGAGTFVNLASLQIKTRLEEIWGYEAMLRAHGYTPATRISNVSQQPVDPKTATDLNLLPSDTILLVEKLFLADEQPVILTRNYIPTHLIAAAYTNDDFHRPIYQFLADTCQQHLAYYLSEIVPLIAPNWLVDTLHLKQKQTALIAFEEIGYSHDNAPILKACSFFRDDLLRLRLIRRET